MNAARERIRPSLRPRPHLSSQLPLPLSTTSNASSTSSWDLVALCSSSSFILTLLILAAFGFFLYSVKAPSLHTHSNIESPFTFDQGDSQSSSFVLDHTNTPISGRRAIPNFSTPRVILLQSQTSPGPDVTVVTLFSGTNPDPQDFLSTWTSLKQQSLQNFRWIVLVSATSTAFTTGSAFSVSIDDPRLDLIRFGSAPLEAEVTAAAEKAEDEADHPRLALQTALEKVRSRLLLFLDAGLLLEPSALEKMAWFLEAHPSHSFTKGRTAAYGAHERMWPDGLENPALFLSSFPITNAVMIRSSHFRAVGGFADCPSTMKGLELWCLLLKLADQRHWGATIPEVLDWTRQDPVKQTAITETAATQLAIREAFPRLFQSTLDRYLQLETPKEDSFDEVNVQLPFVNVLRKETRRMLLIVPWIVMGGADKFVLDLVKLMSTATSPFSPSDSQSTAAKKVQPSVGGGWEVTVATTLPSDNEWAPLMYQYTSDVFFAPHLVPRACDMARLFVYLMHTRRPDLVLITNNEHSYHILPLLRGYSRLYLSPPPVFLDYTHMETQNFKHGGFARLALGSQGWLDQNLVASSHLKSWMVANGAREDLITPCPICVDTELFERNETLRVSLRERMGLPADEIIILFAARIVAQKQPLLFSDVVSTLSRAGYHFSVIVAGEGEERMALESALRSASSLLGRVFFLGGLDSDAIRQVMSISDIYFLPSTNEGIALAIYEAMSMELAVVGADVGGQRELIPPECDCGVLVSRDGGYHAERERYLRAIERFLKYPNECREVGRRAGLRVRQHFPMESLLRCVTSVVDRFSNPLLPSKQELDLQYRIGYETTVRGLDLFRCERGLRIQQEQIWKLQQQCGSSSLRRG
mmetsp:Transcript_17578/g.52625  ORF Transcript_17578/g.52625 Transcript_17578/m.52625 type:complete len:870 (-) Transcript_17578:1737-4346(-)